MMIQGSLIKLPPETALFSTIIQHKEWNGYHTNYYLTVKTVQEYVFLHLLGELSFPLFTWTDFEPENWESCAGILVLNVMASRVNSKKESEMKVRGQWCHCMYHDGTEEEIT